jgi:hypothetical protein
MIQSVLVERLEEHKKKGFSVSWSRAKSGGGELCLKPTASFHQPRLLASLLTRKATLLHFLDCI